MKKIQFTMILAILLCFNTVAQIPNYHQSSSSAIAYIAWGSDWWYPNTNHDLRYAEAYVSLTYTQALCHPTFLNAHLYYSQAIGTVTVDIYISTSKQIIMDVNSKYHHANWWNGDNANFGHYVGQVVTDHDGVLASFNIESWVAANPSEGYYILFDQRDDYHDAVLNEAWIGENGMITYVTEPSATNSTNTSNLEVYPNPFSYSTTLFYSLQDNEVVNIKVFDTNGKLVDVLINNEWQSKGEHQVTWDCNTNSLSKLSRGIYILCLETRTQVLQKKVVVGE